MQQANQYSGIPLDQLVGVSPQREDARARASRPTPGASRARLERLHAALESADDEREFLRAEVQRLHERAEVLERHLNQVTMLLRHEQIRRGELESRMEIEATDFDEPDDPATELRAEPEPIPQEPDSLPRRVGQWFAMLFRDEDEDLLR